MKNNIKAILMVLLFVVLLSPIKVNAFSPAHPYPLGIVVEVEPCEFGSNGVTRDDFIIDVVVRKDDLEFYDTEPFGWSSIPNSVRTSEYANLDNEWISAILYLGYAEWENGVCDSIMFGYGEDLKYFGIDEFKVVVYQDGMQPVESTIFRSSSLATWEDPVGFKIIYNHVEQTFIQRGYEAETYDNNGGFFDFEILILFIIWVVLVLFAAIESLIYLFARQNTKSIIISLGINSLVISMFFIQFTDVSRQMERFYMIQSLWVIPALYLLKVVLLKKYSYETYKVSILLSSIWYLIYMYVVIQAYM